MNGGNLECARRLGGQLPGMRCLGLATGPVASSSVFLRGRPPATVSWASLTDSVIASRQYPWFRGPVRLPLLALLGLVRACAEAYMSSRMIGAGRIRSGSDPGDGSRAERGSGSVGVIGFWLRGRGGGRDA